MPYEKKYKFWTVTSPEEETKDHRYPLFTIHPNQLITDDFEKQEEEAATQLEKITNRLKEVKSKSPQDDDEIYQLQNDLADAKRKGNNRLIIRDIDEATSHLSFIVKRLKDKYMFTEALSIYIYYNFPNQ